MPPRLQTQPLEASSLPFSPALLARFREVALSLGGNGIGPAGALHLSWALRANVALQELALRECALDDQGVIWLSQPLKRNRALLLLFAPAFALPAASTRLASRRGMGE